MVVFEPAAGSNSFAGVEEGDINCVPVRIGVSETREVGENRRAKGVYIHARVVTGYRISGNVLLRVKRGNADGVVCMDV
jgi:hypothetical protein